MSFASFERKRLAALLHEVGPDAPTLCEGWTTRDLASHLWVREHEPLAALGIGIPALSSRHDDAVARHAQRGYGELVDGWAAGPPALLKPIDSVMNTAENFVHHEDVRRGGGVVEPREFSNATNELLWKITKRMAPMLLRGSQVHVVLVPDKGIPFTVNAKRGVARLGNDVVRATGDVGEILMWVFGRDAVELSVQGDISRVSR